MPLNEKTSLLVSQNTGQSFPVAVHLVGLLQGMCNFRTPSEHRERLPKHVKEQLNLQATTSLLESLLEAGLATSADQLIDYYQQQTEASVGESTGSCVFILTCDREKALERLLASLFDNADLSIHEAIYVLDDSRDPAIAAGNQVLIEGYRDPCPVPLHYYGEVEKNEFLQRLVAGASDHEASIRYLLDRSHWQGHKTYGLSRNWALVLSAGRRCIMLDDDVLCEAFYPPDPQEGVRFANTLEVKVLASEADWRNQVTPTGFDPLAGHLQLLGKDVKACIAGHAESGLTAKELDGMNASQLTTLSPQSPILVSECGTFGDPGFPSHAFLLKNTTKAIEETLSRDPDLSLTFGERQFQAVQQSLCVYDSAGISQVTGLDNTRLLPPYFPAFRGEDGVFGWFVKQMYPESRTVIYNWGIPHQPIDVGRKTVNDEAVIPPMGLGDFQGLCTDRASLAGKSTPLERLSLLAVMIRDLCKQPQADLVALAKRETARKSAAVYFDASTRIPFFTGSSAKIVTYFQEAQKMASQYLQSPPALAKWFEMPANCDDREVVSRITSGALGFANALEAWPVLWEVARRENEGSKKASEG